MKLTGTKEQLVDGLAKAKLDADIIYDLDLKKHVDRYSNRALNYAWQLMDKIAKHKSIRSTKDKIYVQMLVRAGTCYTFPALPEEVEGMKNLFRIVYDRGPCVLTTRSGNVVECRQLQCYKGLSLYNKDEMSSFIDGLVSEAQDLGIETEPRNELTKMLEEWGEEYEKRQAAEKNN